MMSLNLYDTERLSLRINSENHRSLKTLLCSQKHFFQGGPTAVVEETPNLLLARHHRTN